MRAVVPVSLRQMNIAWVEKVANAIEARFAIDVEPVVDLRIKGMKYFSSLGRTFPKVVIERLSPTIRMQASSVRDDTVEIE